MLSQALLIVAVVLGAATLAVEAYLLAPLLLRTGVQQAALTPMIAGW